MCRRIVYSVIGKSLDMSDDHLTLRGVLVSIGLSILVFFVFAGSFGDWLDDYVSDEFSPLAVVLFVVFLGGVLYVEYQREQTREKEGKVHHWFSKETHELWNSKDTKGKVVYVLVNIIAAIIGILLAIYLFLTLAFWFFCSMADGQSCGVEVVFWGIGFL
jgi:hypothetical protein